ncbi:NAD-dependent epimerase/dehydratase family protein [Chitinophaga ginsengisegetis]|uniref:NAD-dependent epimerase/dehydratase family protein n=1 Tax=Chitinophaga ginsengisegetis TaxID=393003 RepID=UPI00341BAC64
MRYKNVLITGGAGFIGSNLSLKLIERGYTITVLDKLSEQIHGADPETDSPLYNSIKSKVNFIRGSVTSRQDWLKALENQDVIVHLAAETGTGQSMYEIERYTTENIGATALMLDILTNTRHSVKKVVIASSRAIYGEGRYIAENNEFVYPEARKEEDMLKGDFEVKHPVTRAKLALTGTDEQSKIHPTSVYGITKQVQEQLVMTVCKTIGIAAVAFRYQNVYGPGQSLTNPYTGILSIFSSLIKNGKAINIFEDGEESRDFVFIDDVVDATILGIEKEAADNEVFNVGTGVPVDVITVVKNLIACYGIPVDFNISGNFRLGDIRHNYADLEKITRKLGFAPKIKFEDGLRKFADWVNMQQVNTTNTYEQSIEEMKAKGLYK